MTPLFLVVGAATELESDELLAAAVLTDFSFDLGSLKEGGADFDIAALAHQENLGDLDGCAHFCIEFLDAKDGSSFDAVLLTAGLDNRLLLAHLRDDSFGSDTPARCGDLNPVPRYPVPPLASCHRVRGFERNASLWIFGRGSRYFPGGAERPPRGLVSGSPDPSRSSSIASRSPRKLRSRTFRLAFETRTSKRPRASCASTSFMPALRSLSPRVPPRPSRASSSKICRYGRLSALLLALSIPACKRPPPKPQDPSSATTSSSLTLRFPAGTPASRTRTAHKVWPWVQRYARRYALNPQIVLAIIWVESRFDPRAKSHAGARGLMQLMPRTARALTEKLSIPNKSLSDPAHNIQLGCYYYARLLRRFSGRQDLALAAYNAGPGRVNGWRKAGKGLPDYSRRYIRSILNARSYFKMPPRTNKAPAK